VNSHIFPWLYDAFMRTAERGRLAGWRRSVAAPATGRIIEIGAGTGLNFRHFRAGATVFATDRDLAMLRRARDRARWSSVDILLVVADAEALPFRAHTFDDAVVGFAFCTIPRPARALTELRRVLQPRATCRLLEHVRVDHRVVGKLQDWATPVWRRIAGGCRLNRTTLEILAASGFSLDSVRSHVGGFVVEVVARPRSLLVAANDREAVMGGRLRASGDRRPRMGRFPLLSELKKADR
jgi:ubiquinone/menaquinone biosynthesis C-methylase UbiE